MMQVISTIVLTTLTFASSIDEDQISTENCHILVSDANIFAEVLTFLPSQDFRHFISGIVLKKSVHPTDSKQTVTVPQTTGKEIIQHIIHCIVSFKEKPYSRYIGATIGDQASDKRKLTQEPLLSWGAVNLNISVEHYDEFKKFSFPWQLISSTGTPPLERSLTTITLQNENPLVFGQSMTNDSKYYVNYFNKVQVMFEKWGTSREAIQKKHQ